MELFNENEEWQSLYMYFFLQALLESVGDLKKLVNANDISCR